MEKENKMTIYEVGYLFVSTIAEENVGGEVTRLKDEIAKHGGVFISDEYPKLIDLAYEMTRSISNKKAKFSQGYFGWVKFELPTENALVLKDALDQDESIIRFIMIKTVRENTLAPKRSYSKDSKKKSSSGTKSSTKDEPKEEINEETIDQDIEALVVE